VSIYTKSKKELKNEFPIKRHKSSIFYLEVYVELKDRGYALLQAIVGFDQIKDYKLAYSGSLIMDNEKSPLITYIFTYGIPKRLSFLCSCSSTNWSSLPSS
jgi:hypothetical protein